MAGLHPPKCFRQKAIRHLIVLQEMALCRLLFFSVAQHTYLGNNMLNV